MGILTDWLTDWLTEILIEGIMGNLTGLFDTVNTRVGEIAVQVGTTPAAWNAGVFSLIRQLSETVILPIAGLVLTFVATYELIQLLIEKNNLHDLDYWIFFKWIFKTACAILVLSNTFNIVNAVFDVSQSVIARAGGVIQGSTDITPTMLDNLEATLETMGIGSLLGLFMQSLLIHVTMWALNIIIFAIVYGRMLEIYMTPARMEDMGVSADDAAISSQLLTAIFSYMGRDDLANYEKEAKGLNTVLQMAMSAQDSDSNKLFSTSDTAKDGVLPTAATTVSNVMDSEAISYALVEVLTDGQKVTTVDPFELGSEIEDEAAEQEAFLNAIRSHKSNNPSKNPLAYEALAALFNLKLN